MSAVNRREALGQWVDLGFDSLPFGAGIGVADTVETTWKSGIVAHNAFVSAFGEGGVAGLLIDVMTLLAFACFISRRSEPFAMMGIVVVTGGLFLSYPGNVLMVLPLGLADGIRAAQLGIAARRGAASPASHSRSDLQSPRESMVQPQPRSSN